MATVYDFPTGGDHAGKSVAALAFEPVDLASLKIPTPQEWVDDLDRLHFALTMAQTTLLQSKEQLQKTIGSRDADGLLEILITALRHGAERFGHFQALCEAAEARIYVAAEALAEDVPADA